MINCKKREREKEQNKFKLFQNLVCLVCSSVLSIGKIRTMQCLLLDDFFPRERMKDYCSPWKISHFPNIPF